MVGGGGSSGGRNADPILFRDIMEVKKLGEKKFDRVTRVEGKLEGTEYEVILDVNTEVYPVEYRKYTFVLLNTLNPDGSVDPNESWVPRAGPSLADQYEYVMHGKVFKHEADKSREGRVSMFISFGGLMLKLVGESRSLKEIRLDKRVYLGLKLLK